MAYIDHIFQMQMCLAGQSTLVAAHVITPGSLIERTHKNEVAPHSIAGGQGQTMVAIEDVDRGVDDNYAIGDTVRYKICRAGDVFYGFLTAGFTVTVGQFLVSASNGTFKGAKYPPEGIVFGIALENLTAEGNDIRLLIETI